MGGIKVNADSGLRAVELVLLWEGRLRNARLRSMLDVHFTTASRLVTAYRELNPRCCEYEQSSKSYIASPAMRAVVTDGSVDEYLALVDRTRSNSDAVVRTRVDLGDVQSTLFSLMYRACEDGSGVRINHHSLNRMSRSRRRIWPHALVQAGRRWHVRAWCEQASAFRDFALGRIRDAHPIEVERPEPAHPDLDEAWQTHVMLRLIAHPNLSSEQQRVVRSEYFKGNSARVLDERAALLPYVIHELRAALDTTNDVPPAFQLAVAEPEALKKWLLPDRLSMPDELAE